MDYEAEIAEGLVPIAEEEIRAFIGKSGSIGKSHRPDSLAFHYAGKAEDLLALRAVIAIYQVLYFDVPRPKALLGHQHLQRLLDAIRPILALGKFQSLHINAAGSDSSVMQRIKEELARALGLEIGQEEGDLVLRIRRNPKNKTGWDILLRISPRPLASREWRVCNYQGALNAAIASAMIHYTNPTPQDSFLNIACGSGTILIERAIKMPAQAIIGIDIAPETLACAKENINAAGQKSIQLLLGDAIAMPFDDKSISALAADLPFGQLVGSHEENQWLYPAILQEAARVAKQGARFVVISHEVRLMEKSLRAISAWSIKAVQMISLSGLHPRIFVLERQ
jgi:tRNA (guanine6-N2)-methyltransferase